MHHKYCECGPLPTSPGSLSRFDTEAFFLEAARVLRPTGALAAWGYGLCQSGSTSRPCFATQLVFTDTTSKRTIHVRATLQVSRACQCAERGCGTVCLALVQHGQRSQQAQLCCIILPSHALVLLCKRQAAIGCLQRGTPSAILRQQCRLRTPGREASYAGWVATLERLQSEGSCGSKLQLNR